jgi:hypothetical protein
LSIGILPVSAIITIQSAAKAKNSDGFSKRVLESRNVLVILPRFVDPAARETVKTESIIAGSAMEDIIISLLPPMPPKALAVSREDKARKNLPSANKYIISITSPVKFSGTHDERTGTSNAIIKIETNVT